MPADAQPAQPGSSTTRTQTKPPSAGGSLAKQTERTAHIVLQGKGGIGKTLVASLIAQHYQEAGKPVDCYDTDPVNSSFSSIRGLSAKPVQILKGRALNVEAIDGMLHQIMTGSSDSVIDNGAASFVPFADYLLKSGIADIADTAGCRLVLHVILTGGGGLLDTAAGLLSILDRFPASVRIVLWVNEFFGPFEADGRAIEDAPVYLDNKARFAGIVYLRALDPELDGHTFAGMLQRRVTFAEALADGTLGIIAKQRLVNVRRAIFKQLDPLLA